LIASGLGDLPYAAFGDLRVEKLRSERGSLTVAIAKARRRQSEEELLGWIRSSAALIARYFGRFPADGATPPGPARPWQPDPRPRSGTGGASILFFLGTNLDPAQAHRSWELVHELSTSASLRCPAGITGEEGLAHLCRAYHSRAAGELSRRRFGATRARPPQVCRGEATRASIGRTPGAGPTGRRLFWLLATSRSASAPGTFSGRGCAPRRGRTRGKHRGALAVAARARGWGPTVGTRVLEELYAKMGSTSMKVDLDALFLRLGVALRQGVVELDDRAPLAPIRRASPSDAEAERLDRVRLRLGRLPPASSRRPAPKCVRCGAKRVRGAPPARCRNA